MKRLRVFAIGTALLTATAFFSLAFAGEIRYDSGARRDPLTPLVGPDGVIAIKFNPNDLNIEGIIFDSNRAGSLVLINGDFYKEGQSVKDATIISILKDRVILRQDDEEKSLWMREEIVDPNQQVQPRNNTGPSHEKK